ncbi:MAG: YdcF family protein [Clostridia bacterium]|nr:YdcF family protein [Clostridia bacterium]
MTKKNISGVFRALVSILLLFCLPAALAGCGGADERPAALPDPKRPQQIVEEMAADYGNYGEEAADKIEELLRELSEADRGLGERWKTIMELWRSPDAGKDLHYDCLPDGLPETDELCIVTLGFQLEPDGTMKEELIRRLTVALRSAEKYPNAYIVCTGGGTAPENEEATEAGEMAKWLAARGVDPGRIIVEDHSVTTAQNAIFTYDLLTSLYPSVKKLAIVSSDYHIATGELLFRAESILRANAPGNEKLEVISNAAWRAPSGSLSPMFQAGALIELFGDVDTAFEIYFDTYDIHELPPLR